MFTSARGGWARPVWRESSQDRHGDAYKLQPTETRSGRPKRLRWLREHPDGASLPITLRDLREAVLTLTRIARDGLGIDPAEVEVG